MEKTALNLIAISIFLMTLSCLVGPLIHLSPTIPATLTLGVLTLATLDTLTWQNKGINLLLDTFASPEQRQRIIHHEAGHFLAAYLLDIPVTSYTLTAWETLRQGQSGLGGVIFDTDALSPQLSDGRQRRLLLDRFCTVWMAGIAAETLTYGQAQGGQEDRQKVRMALRSADLPVNQYPQKESWALLQAKNLIQTHQTVYEKLVQAMANRASVAECLEMMQHNV